MNLLDRMIDELPFSKEELLEIIATASYRYKVFQIPKRQPGQWRTIAQPTPEVKLLQRWLVDNVLSQLPVHRAATAYREGVSIYAHAEKHVDKKYLLKMDFQDFFPSISADAVQQHLLGVGKIKEKDATLIRALVTWRNKVSGKRCLSIGAPSSPILSNTMMYRFDTEISIIAKRYGAVYSRYADDMAFSTNRKGVLTELSREVESLCGKLPYPRLTLNKQKTVYTSRAYKRVLVGLVLTPDRKVSLGREKKRELRSKLYRLLKGAPGVDSASLRGELAFANSVEPEFISSLVRQFGTDAFLQLGLPFGSSKA
ncbi:RNA-directed DNA polymerase [Solimonas sp. K1W22B-7]|uniref:retron St85 family RNA-directed DNA polymerase n=1 Tax=Solimonas sp. K1W22B-7 TaxID=2303331 RepID=UPI000E32E309|nr:retron St85 family RNA-directed DNA polymerase [Solimonas sp. K1W22B-7]AXQ28112.1 RNA-directed DNA polymerase [Solimonas sp. K1W22B-7]